MIHPKSALPYSQAVQIKNSPWPGQIIHKPSDEHHPERFGLPGAHPTGRFVPDQTDWSRRPIWHGQYRCRPTGPSI